MPPITGMGGMNTGPSNNFMSRLGQMAPGMLSGMAGSFGDPQISGSGMPMNKMIGMQRPRNRGMQPPVQAPQLVQPPTNIPNIAPGMTEIPGMGRNMAPGLTEFMGPSMPQSVPGSLDGPGYGAGKFTGGNTGISGGGSLWDIYSKIMGMGQPPPRMGMY